MAVGLLADRHLGGAASCLERERGRKFSGQAGSSSKQQPLRRSESARRASGLSRRQDFHLGALVRGLIRVVVRRCIEFSMEFLSSFRHSTLFTTLVLIKRNTAPVGSEFRGNRRIEIPRRLDLLVGLDGLLAYLVYFCCQSRFSIVVAVVVVVRVMPGPI